ncbi:MAG: aminotransferase class IV, partial [Deltaproteobacteria bacterium]|nr:aminotransferase class IV [Deltaproteobacteria bacterium]
RFLTTPAPEFKLIETMLWQPGSGYWLLDLHLDRLTESAGYFSYPLDLDKIKAGLHGLAEKFSSNVPLKNQRVRLTLSKRGELEFSHSELPEGVLPEIKLGNILKKRELGVLPKVIFSEKKTDSQSSYLFHKTTHRKLYDDERSQAAAKGFYEVLFVNEKNEVTEGCYTNIFLQKEGKLLTPPVSCGLLPGVLRNHLLRQYPGLVEETVLTRKDMKQADSVYVGNSVRGLVQVQLVNS